ncbi:phage tail tape measure protein [uncultured Ruminococcus sp.]|uniref:phage tail tape measure protein n=1 Tax=uncultured Ruminococcus sp. TaxID=165186 RepID=UPI002666FDED|nr:phage tail tape measure protein [uncultured Ruminococcus sp.]
MAYDGSIKIDTKIDTSGFKGGIDKIKSIAQAGVSAITATLAGITAALGAGATAAATVGSSFEAAMSKVSAISGATGDSLQSLTDKAKEMGAKTKFSASESASALQYMAMAGWDTESMLNGIDGIMNLAAADGLDLATTSDIVTDALTAFNLKASDSTHFADVLAKASSSANTNVSMLGESFKYVAPLAGTMGYSVEDVSLALGLMANASVKGSMAGTSLKTALSNLASPTEEMSNVMTQYGISISDAEGNALPLIDVMKQLREKFSGLSETEQAAAASTLFGKEAMSGMLAIINASDSDFDNLTQNINNADGAAKSMADTMQDNLQGQITILKSGLEGLGIEIYEGMSEPLQEAAVEAQNYVNRLTEAFQNGGLSEMIEEAGSIFGELAVKAAEAAPEMINAAVDFLQAFVDGIADNSDKLAKSAVDIIQTLITSVTEHAPDLIKAAKVIVSELVDNLNKLLPKELQAPVKEAVNTIKKSFENGGLKKAIESVKNIVINLGKTFTNVAKVVLPPLSKAIDLLADNFNVLLPLVTSLFTAYKSYAIISTVTSLFTAQTAAVTAESLAEAASLGTITLKQIAVAALTGEITLATAAQYAWNLAMSLNPIGIVITAVAALAAGITALCFTMSDTTDQTSDLELAQEKLEESNQNLGESYEEIGSKFTDFLNDISNAGSIFDNFNEEIIISDDEKQELADNIDSVQKEITDICSNAADERRKLTDGEIERLEDLFQKMHELSAQELAIEQAKQGVVITQAQALCTSSESSLEEYISRSKELQNSAEETRTAVIAKAKEQYTEEVALLNQKLKTNSDYTQEQHDADVKAAEDSYQNAIDSANKQAADTVAIIEDGYKQRADVMTEYTDKLTQLNEDEETENYNHSINLGKIEKEYYDKLDQYREEGLQGIDYETMRTIALDEMKEKETAENQRHIEAITKTRNSQQKLLDDKNYQNQLAGFLALEGLYETYSGKTNEKSQEIVDAFHEPMKNLPKKTKEAFIDAVGGGIEGLNSMKESMFSTASNIASSVIGIFKSVFDEHSPSKVFRKIFKYTLEGGENGLEDEAPKLYKQADDVAATFTERLKSGVSADGLVSKMRTAISAQKVAIAQEIASKTSFSNELLDAIKKIGDKSFLAKGEVQTRINVDGRELAVALTPFVSEELAFNTV